MLKRENRLLKRKDFGEIREKGRMSWGLLMGMSYIESNNQETITKKQTVSNVQAPITKQRQKNENRFGVVVSKKISNLAVVRNKIRRQIYKAIGGNLNTMENRGLRVIFLVKKNIVGAKNEVVEREVKELFNKLDLRSKI